MSLATVAAIFAIAVQVLALVGVVWWGGILVGRITSSVDVLSEEVTRLRTARHTDANTLAGLSMAVSNLTHDVRSMSDKIDRRHLERGAM
jgi:hypothetical protein